MMREIPVSDIEPNRFNPNLMAAGEFESLCEEMRQAGAKHDVISPIIVSPKKEFYNTEAEAAEKYVIVDGENRWKAAKTVGWTTIPCEIQVMSESHAKAINYRKNKERGSIDPLREASLFKSELDAGLTQEQVAEKYGISQPYVANRVRLVKLNPEVVEAYHRPREKFKEIELKDYEERVEEWEQEKEKRKATGFSWMNKPEKPDKEDLIPHGILSTSHLEAISVLPEDSQIDIAHRVLTRGWSARETEEAVQREKREIAEKRQFEELIAKAVTKTCPKCGSEPKDLDYDKKMRCSSYSCDMRWDPMKTKKQIEAEIEASRTKEEKQRIEQLKKSFKEARENPGYIKLPETPEELNLIVKPWLVTKVRELTEIDRIAVYGKRGDEVMEIDFQEHAPGFQHMTFTFRVGDEEFGFNVEPKDYKRENAKSRVNLGWRLKPNEKNRERLRRFFKETVNTDLDP